MATRAYYNGTESTGDVLTTTNFNTLAQGLVGYAATGTAQTGITTNTALTSLTVTPSLSSGRILMVFFEVEIAITALTSGDTFAVTLTQGGGAVQTITHSFQYAAGLAPSVFTGFQIAAPGSGSVTWALTGGRTSGTATYTANSNDTARLAVVDLGPAF